MKRNSATAAKVERLGTVWVEGWGGGQRCLVQRNVPAGRGTLYPQRQLGYL
jgi:hypothetical protein